MCVPQVFENQEVENCIENQDISNCLPESSVENSGDTGNNQVNILTTCFNTSQVLIKRTSITIISFFVMDFQLEV